MRVTLLGPVAVEVGDAVVDVLGVRQALIALLALDAAGEVLSIKQLGFGMALAVIVDATIVLNKCGPSTAKARRLRATSRSWERLHAVASADGW